jgi:hypothetical protein
VIACGTCGRTHRTEEAIEKCKARAVKKEAALEKKREDAERRLRNQEAKPPAEVILESLRGSYSRGRISPGSFWRALSTLNKDYPPPPGKKEWTLVDVVELDNRRLVGWPY